MNPQVNGTSGLDLPQPGSDTNQLPPIHAPQTFRAPDTAIPQFNTAPSPIPDALAAAATQPAPVAAVPISSPAQPSASVPDPIAAATAQFTGSDLSAVQTDEIDTPFDEEWVTKAKEIVERTRTDPYTQSHEISKLKAQYIKARYNKDIKVSED
jgi:RecA-family ATPase